MIFRKNSILILVMALVKFLLPFVLHHPAFDLHRDEYLYYQQGQHWDLGFLENPSLIGLLGYISSMFGGGYFWIKFWPGFFGACTILCTAGITRVLGGKQAAQFIACLGILFSAFMRIHFLFQPNFLDIFFWTLTAYYLLRYINTQNKMYCYLMMLALALGWWSKYSVLFFAAALVLSIVLTRHRNMLKEKYFWYAAGLGIILILPNIAWQWMHRWPLVHHMRELKETQLKYLNPFDFIKEQILMLLPVFFVWIGGLIWLLRHRNYRIVSYIFILIVMLVMAGSGKGYYTLGAYPMLLAAGGVWLESITVKKIAWRYAIVIFILGTSILLVPLLLPMQSPAGMQAFNKRRHLEKAGLLKWEDQESHPLQQDFADMLGWKELTTKTESFYTSLPDSMKSNTLVYCRNYGEAGALTYYGRSDDFRKKVICDNGTFLLWIPDHISFQHLVFIGSDVPGKDDEVFRHFESMQVIDSIANPLSREYRTKIVFFKNADDSARIIAAGELARMKAEFGE